MCTDQTRPISSQNFWLPSLYQQLSCGRKGINMSKVAIPPNLLLLYLPSELLLFIPFKQSCILGCQHLNLELKVGVGLKMAHLCSGSLHTCKLNPFLSPRLLLRLELCPHFCCVHPLTSCVSRKEKFDKIDALGCDTFPVPQGPLAFCLGRGRHPFSSSFCNSCSHAPLRACGMP